MVTIVTSGIQSRGAGLRVVRKSAPALAGRFGSCFVRQAGWTRLRFRRAVGLRLDGVEDYGLVRASPFLTFDRGVDLERRMEAVEDWPEPVGRPPVVAVLSPAEALKVFRRFRREPEDVRRRLWRWLGPRILVWVEIPHALGVLERYSGRWTGRRGGSRGD
jgi:hypothetical protein